MAKGAFILGIVGSDCLCGTERVLHASCAQFCTHRSCGTKVIYWGLHTQVLVISTHRNLQFCLTLSVDADLAAFNLIVLCTLCLACNEWKDAKISNIVSRWSLWPNFTTFAGTDFGAKKSARIKQVLVLSGKQSNLSVKIVLCRCMSFFIRFQNIITVDILSNGYIVYHPPMVEINSFICKRATVFSKTAKKIFE